MSWNVCKYLGGGSLEITVNSEPAQIARTSGNSSPKAEMGNAHVVIPMWKGLLLVRTKLHIRKKPYSGVLPTYRNVD